ncbi:integrase core domain-containing protein [Streptomyces syringium]|uniref:integrase core domain-containing protein n=1 Tax=Streptomyces syringium TaxID=76729 RepID=UPI003455535E
MRRSMGPAGSSNDNAVAESSWQGLKRETVHQRPFSTMRQSRLEVFQWLTYCTPCTRHSGLNYLSPGGFEQQHQRGRKLTLAALTPRVHTPRDTSPAYCHPEPSSTNHRG